MNMLYSFKHSIYVSAGSKAGVKTTLLRKLQNVNSDEKGLAAERRVDVGITDEREAMYQPQYIQTIGETSQNTRYLTS